MKIRDDYNKIHNYYPYSDEYDYESYIELIDFDKEHESDLSVNKGFDVEPAKSIKKDLKADNGIFSPRFGQTLQDVNPFIDRYKCACSDGTGLKGRINAGMRCPKCGKVCRFVDDDFTYFGWLVINEYHIIHPAFYKKIESFLGKGISVSGSKRTKLENILDINNDIDLISKKPKLTGDPNIDNPALKKYEDHKKKIIDDEPFFGIGMIEFYNRFDEIMDFYLVKKANRRIYYDDIYSHREKVFTHCIPVFSTLLRPFDTRDNVMSYEPTNAMYTMMNKLVTVINKNRSKMEREPKAKNQSLYNLQKKFMELYGELEAILSGKKGDFRCLLGGRYNFSSRNVIVQNPELRIDEVTLPIVALIIMLEQRIKNILHRFYNYSPADAHAEWYKSVIEPTKKVKGIVQSIIDNYKNNGDRGIPVLINRNPKFVGNIQKAHIIHYSVY